MDPETSFSEIFNQSDADKSASIMASGSQDPAFTPSSTTELPSRPGVRDTAVGRVLPFSQVAPGLDTPIPIGESTAPLGTGAAGAAGAAGASTGAVTGAPGAAGAQVLESAAHAQARRRPEGLWASSKSTSLPFRCQSVRTLRIRLALFIVLIIWNNRGLLWTIYA